MIACTSSKRSRALRAAAYPHEDRSGRSDSIRCGGDERVLGPRKRARKARRRALLKMGPEALILAERVPHAAHGLAEIFLEQMTIGQILGNLAQGVHVVGDDQQAGGPGVLGEGAKGVAHHGRTGNLAEGAQVRQTRSAISALEDDRRRQGRKSLRRLAGLARGDQRGGRNRRVSSSAARRNAQQPREQISAPPRKARRARLAGRR